MNKLIAITSTIIIILNACSNEQSLTNEINLQAITNFNIDTVTPIKDEKIRVVYCSSVENPNLEKEYLIQFMAVRINTGDTINIISDHSEHIKKDDADQVFLLNRRALSDYHIQFNVDSAVYESIKQNGVDISTMVISDPNFKKMEDNKHITIIGDISR